MFRTSSELLMYVQFTSCVYGEPKRIASTFDDMMLSLLSSLADNLVKGLHKDKCKDCKSNLPYMTVNDSSLVFKC